MKCWGELYTEIGKIQSNNSNFRSVLVYLIAFIIDYAILNAK